MKRILIIVPVLALLASCAPKGYTGYSWEYHEIDGRFDNGPDTAAIAAIAKYDDKLAPLQEIICYSDDVYVKDRPESGLSNFLADALREFAQQYTGETIDLAVTNFGGIRNDMPKGAVRIFDIYAIAPFNNYITILTFDGKTLRDMFEFMSAKGNIQAWSGLKLKVVDRRMVECLVGGKPIDINREYKIATIDFLVTGGDGVDLSSYTSRGDTNVPLREAYVEILKQKMAAGETLHLEKDGRVVITRSNK